MSAYLPQELIRKKRDGGALDPAEIAYFVAEATRGTIADYQVSAMLMAIFWRGLSGDELAAWADAMLHSGDVLDLGDVGRPKIDKHSTGGVGDKISIPLAPAVAACGIAVPMVSGRGLGHTGGTLDKLESIPGFRVDLDVDHFAAQVRDIGVCLIGQTERIAPADRKFYALRDVTATVESIPLIASSIMSKKLAEGIDGLVLDCKVGRGAFMKTREQARDLAQAIRTIGAAAGKKVSVLITAMDSPIGRTVGNALEVRESIEVLQGAGDADTRALTGALGGEMLAVAGLCDHEEGVARVLEALDDGRALDVFRRVVEAQGGDPRVCDDPRAVLPSAKHELEIRAQQAGTIATIVADQVGIAALHLGAGRRRKEDAIDPAVGVELHVATGDRIEKDQLLATIAHNEVGVEACAELVSKSIVLGDGQAMGSRVLEVLR